MTNGTMIKQASEKQLKWLRDLLKDKDYSDFPESWRNVCQAIKERFAQLEAEGYGPEAIQVQLITEDRDPITHDDFQRLLPRLQAAPKLKAEGEQGHSPIATTDGMFKKGDTFYKLRFAKTGKLWAHRLVFLMTPEQAKVAAAAGSKERAAKFKFAGSPQTLGIRDDMSLTYEDAKAFGALYSMCCECGRLLTNDLSVALGIGPVCGGRAFGGEFKFMIADAKLAVEAASKK